MLRLWLEAVNRDINVVRIGDRRFGIAKRRAFTSGQDLNFKFESTPMSDGKCADGRSCVRPGRDDEMDGLSKVGECDVFGRRFVRVEPMGMRVVDAEKIEPAMAELLHQADELVGRNLVIPYRIRGNVLRRECARD